MTSTVLLQEATNAVNARGKSYGTELELYTNHARIWSVILGVDVTPLQVLLCIDAMKTCRLMVTPSHFDSVIDKAGYANVYFNVIQQQKGTTNELGTNLTDGQGSSDLRGTVGEQSERGYSSPPGVFEGQ